MSENIENDAAVEEVPVAVEETETPAEETPAAEETVVPEVEEAPKAPEAPAAPAAKLNPKDRNTVTIFAEKGISWLGFGELKEGINVVSKDDAPKWFTQKGVRLASPTDVQKGSGK